MKFLFALFKRNIPAYFWIAVAYAIFLAVAAITGPGETPAGTEPLPFNQQIEAALASKLFSIPLFSGTTFAITWTVIFILLGFLSSWIEVVRATYISNTARNDTWSLIMTLIAFVLFVGVPAFGTTAFLIVAVVGFGDVLLDRYVGQAVARRDFGGMFRGGMPE